MRRASTQPALLDGLLERVMDRNNLRRAWQQVKANRGAPGVDGMTVDDFVAFAREHWPAIRQALLDGTYSPQPVRRVEIPKPLGRGVRLLGIPTVLDRLIAQAIQQAARYADDRLILAGSVRAGDRVKASITRYLTSQLKPKVNESKSRVCGINEVVWSSESSLKSVDQPSPSSPSQSFT